MKILFLPNWNVKRYDSDPANIQAPDKLVTGEPYRFFRHFPKDTQVDVLDIGTDDFIRKIEHKIKFYIKQPLQAFRRRDQYDLVISHGAQSGLVYELLTSFCRHKPPHLMFDIGGLNGARINHTETPIIRFALRKAPHIIVHSSRQLSLYEDHYPCLARHAHFIPFGTDFNYFNDATRITPPIRKSIVAVGYAKRDYDTLCKAFTATSRTDYELHIIGDTTLQNTYRDDKRIHFHKFMPLAELMHFTLESAFVVVPLPEYLYSYGQMSFLQSMAMEKAAIVTLTTSSRDYVADAPGVLSPEPYNTAQMRQALEQYMSTPLAQLQQIGRSNACYVRQHFNEQQMALGILDIINKMPKHE